MTLHDPTSEARRPEPSFSEFVAMIAATMALNAMAIDAILNQKGRDVCCVYVAIGQKNSTVAALTRSRSPHLNAQKRANSGRESRASISFARLSAA